MTDQNKAAANQAVPPEFNTMPLLAGLTGLFDEMQALLTMMPGAGMDNNPPLSTDAEIEAMFDNMPV